MGLKFLGLLLLATFSSVKVSEVSETVIEPIEVTERISPWADSVIKTMSIEDKIGQLFMVAAYSNKDESHYNEIDDLIKNQKIGGLIFFQGGPSREINLTNRYQAKSKIPLMIGMDAEWGLAMRLDSTFKFPKQMTMGAMQNNLLIEQMGKQVAKHCKRIGVHVNFAPVIDVNNNPNNPVINYRSFGEDRENVSQKGIAYIKGLQANGVMANGKHFPGHGDTDMDSHKSLPTVNHELKRLDSLEFYPFKKAFEQDLASVMVAHLYIPALDARENKATTLSPYVVTDLLKKQMNFKGLVFTDALNMKGVSAFQNPGDVDLEALLAGNDVLLFSLDVKIAIEKIKGAIDEGKISKKAISKKAHKILKYKEWYGASKFKDLGQENLSDDLNNAQAKVVRRRIYENAITLIKNNSALLPVKGLANKKITCLSMGAEKSNAFSIGLERYAKIEKLAISKTDNDFSKIQPQLDQSDIVIINTQDLSQRTKQNFGMSQDRISLIEKIAENKQVILVHFGNPYALSGLNTDNIESLIIAYEEQEDALDVASQIVFGGLPAKGRLPVSINNTFKVGTGIDLKEIIRLSYGIPENIGISSKPLMKIDSIVEDAINLEVMPGCQLMAIKDGKVFYNKVFGKHTYEGKEMVGTNDVYDIASITKIMASTSSLMKLESEGKFNVEDSLEKYLPEMIDTSKYYKGLKIKHMLTHQAGLVSWIPFYVKTLHKNQPSFKLYAPEKTAINQVQVANGLYMNEKYKDTIFKRILTTPLRSKKKYKYSDLGYYFIKEIIESQSRMKMQDYVQKDLYEPLGLHRMTYLPLDKYPLSQIIPTERDGYFRHQLVHGHVHDQGAAMLGGVGGHAGIFANANSVAVMMQMFLNNGSYGGEKFIDSAVIAKYTSSPYLSNGNRRGIGFDKPVRAGGAGPTCSKCASSTSYGHSGFTGTVTWADPKSGLIYVFLSNRVYPSAENRKLIKMSVRTNIQQILYNAVNSADESKLDL